MHVRAKQRLCYQRLLVNPKLRFGGFAPRHLSRYPLTIVSMPRPRNKQELLVAIVDGFEQLNAVLYLGIERCDLVEIPKHFTKTDPE